MQGGGAGGEERAGSRPWRIHEIAPDFEVEDVWRFCTPGACHLSWVPGHRWQLRAADGFLGQDERALGRICMTAIKPFRYPIVYPA